MQEVRIEHRYSSVARALRDNVSRYSSRDVEQCFGIPARRYLHACLVQASRMALNLPRHEHLRRIEKVAQDARHWTPVRCDRHGDSACADAVTRPLSCQRYT